MDTRREICRNCRYFAPQLLDGPEPLDQMRMGECLNPESDYEHRTVDETFGCEYFEFKVDLQ